MVNTQKRKKVTWRTDINTLTALNILKNLIESSGEVATVSTRSGLITESVRRYVVDVTKVFIEKHGQNNLTREILSLIENPQRDMIWLWETLK